MASYLLGGRKPTPLSRFVSPLPGPEGDIQQAAVEQEARVEGAEEATPSAAVGGQGQHFPYVLLRHLLIHGL